MWLDRAQAGDELAGALGAYEGRPATIVLGVPRGGVAVARRVADRLRLPLDIVVVRKIGAPDSPEFAAGAVDADGDVYANPRANVSDAWLERAAVAEHDEVLRRADAYRGGRPARELAGATAIVVDDGIATGLTAQGALRWLKRHGVAQAVIAAPVMAPDAVAMLSRDADEVVALATPRDFAAVGSFYVQFPQLTDGEVVELLRGA
jgi:predicted phosphoribosyltransferase